MTRKRPSAIAYSYTRFSSLEQAKGDSLRRQEALRDAWLAKTGVDLDASLTLRDEGVSAFSGGHRENPDRHALAAFLELVKRGNIPRGSYLLVESLDRLSREHIRPALTLLLNLIEAGIRIVQLLPTEAVYDEKVEPMTLMMAIMELSRGHSESQMKSERVGNAWREKKRTANGSAPITARVPAWLSVVDGQFVVDAGKANAVRRIFGLAAEGHGISSITKKLNAEGVTPIARAGYWARSYVAKLLTNRAVVGEYQPHTGRGGKRRIDGQPVPNYFPAIVTEELWDRARVAAMSRLHKGGRPSVRISLFTGLLRDARDGGRLHQVNKGRKGAGVSLVPYRATNGVKGAKYVSFPVEVLERAVLSCLREIDPRDVLPRENHSGDEILQLTRKRGDLEKRIEKVKAQFLTEEDLAPLVEVLRTLENKRQVTADQLAEANRKAVSPLSAVWAKFDSLLAALEAAPDPLEARVRLRSALRRMVDGVWCLFTRSGARRLAAVQLHFLGGARRDYLILYKPATGGAVGVRPALWWTRSLADVAKTGPLDLRKRADANNLEAALLALDLQLLELELAD